MELTTAYHEAGHAIVACMIPLDIVKITIIPTEDSLGGCEVDLEPYFFKNLSTMHQATMDLVKFHLAGEIAELKFLNDNGISVSSTTTAADDHRRVVHYINTFAENGEPIDRESLCGETARLISSPEIWPMVQKLAAELYRVKTLEESALRQALDPITASIEWAAVPAV